MIRNILILVFSCNFLTSWSSDHLDFDVKVNKIPLEYTISSFLAMPGDTLNIVFSGNSTDQFVGKYDEGQLIQDSRLKWRYIVPAESGHYEFIILHNDPPEKLILNVFVLTPASLQKGEYLNGYRIGNYPQVAFNGNPKYLPPKGFIEVTPENGDIFVSNHFQLKQFLCKQQPDHWPKYVLIDPLLLIKLELLIDRLAKKGIPADHLFIMSGYRTPFYNASIKNGRYSRHIYGDAADVYVDENNDAVIDDLNNDGIASMADAEVIYQTVENIENESENKALIGGMGKYKKTASHTWDVHVDTRGFRARW